MDSPAFTAGEKVNFGEELKGSGINAEPFDVTMRNVSRIVKTGKKESFSLIDDISLYFKVCISFLLLPYSSLHNHQPGTMTLVLGAPGCGKTTLFKVLANHGAKKKKTQTGQVLFNGKPANRKTHHQSVAYVTQEDTHFGMFI
jgi:ABC-type dipeptide/oligopeptide/nickel transport system ATPase subunit